MIQKINDWWQNRKAKKLASSVAQENNLHSNKIDCGNFYIITVGSAITPQSTWLVAYPKNVLHLEKLVKFHLSKGPHLSPYYYCPGSLGTVGLMDVIGKTGEIRFIQGSYKLKDDNTKPEDEKFTFDRKEFRKLYANWRVALLDQALTHLRTSGADKIMLSLVGAGISKQRKSNEIIQKELGEVCRKKNYAITHNFEGSYSHVTF